MQYVKQLLNQSSYFIRLLFPGQHKYFDSGVLLPGWEHRPYWHFQRTSGGEFSLICLVLWYIIATAFATTELDAAIRRSRDSEIAPTARRQRL